MDIANLEAVKALELKLLGVDVRSERAALDELLHEDFTEIGASGRLWQRGPLIEDLLAAPEVSVDVTQLDARAIDEDVVLVTYQTASAERTVLRSSWWVRVGEDWQIIFHQGTPTDS